MVKRWRSVDVGRGATHLPSGRPPDTAGQRGRLGRAAATAMASAVVGALTLGVTAPAALAADDCANAALRTGLSPQLPDCRAYERVSPADSSSGLAGVSVNFQPMFGKSRADGDRVLFGSSGGFGDVERGWFNGYNIGTRTADGWRSFQAMTAAEPTVDLDLGSHAPATPLPAEDQSRVAFRLQRGLGGANPTSNTGYSAYLTAPWGTGAPTWLSQPTVAGPIPATGTGGALTVGGSSDLSTVYFTFQGKLTDQDGDGARNPTTMNGQNGLYMYRGGVLSPAGRLPTGLVDPGGAEPAGSGSLGPANSAITHGAVRNTVSRDGSKLFFVSPSGGAGVQRQLYVQEDGRPGRLISKDVAGDPAGSGVTELRGWADGGGAQPDGSVQTGSFWYGLGYAFATPDGSKVIFRSTSVLAAGAPSGPEVKTYRASITSGAIALEYLPQVTGLPLAVSDDGSRVLFAKDGFAAPGAGLRTDLFFWDEHRPGGVPYPVASNLDAGDAVAANVRLTPDGSTLLFDSSEEIVPGVVMPDPNVTQVYRWVVGDTHPVCLSCRGDGQPFGRFGSRSTNAPLLLTDNLVRPGGSRMDGLNQSSMAHTQGVSDDGRRVFFDAIDPLDPVRDTNGQRDVYVWEDGAVHLITSGKGRAPSFLIDSSASGDDVFFTTMDGLIPEDRNNDYDVYDARVDGGFVPEVVPSCSGDGCQPPTGAGPSVAAPQSPLVAPVTVGGKKLLKPQKEKPKKLRVTRGKSTRTRVVLKVRTPGAGRIRARGKGLRTAHRKAKRAATYTVKVALTKRSRRTLARKGRLRVRVSVRFSPAKGRAVTKTARVTIKRHARSNGRGR